ncbi:MAG: DegT/DnrJ/EryC1/StrS family aminotransferase [Candidatus Woesebacteria bacterium]|jgi:dTDP-4-amino-4,6-dideoxygalactose transaminase
MGEKRIMKSIFNSLGSNYDWQFAKLALSQIFKSQKSALAQKNLTKLKELLEQNFQGRALLFYKGRDAIEFTLEAAGISSGDEVLTQAFTCYAIEEAILRTGAKAVYVDIAKNELNLSVKTLKQALEKASNPKAVIVQHSLGTIADILAIKKFCQENKLLLIEDLAQGLGGVDNQGEALGKYADAVILSFGRDKIIDTVAGGAVILKNEKIKAQAPKKTGLKIRYLVRDLSYPFLTLLIRQTYDWKIGKLIHFLAKKIKLIKNPTLATNQHYLPMPAPYAELALKQFSQLKQQLTHRKKIAQLYFKELDVLAKKAQIRIITRQKDLVQGSNLRFSLTVAEPQKLISFLAKNKIYLADRWYRAAVDCGKNNCQTSYQVGNCPQAEKMAASIINLPTHQNIKIKDAQRIVQTIENWTVDTN